MEKCKNKHSWKTGIKAKIIFKKSKTKTVFSFWIKKYHKVK